MGYYDDLVAEVKKMGDRIKPVKEVSQRILIMKEWLLISPNFKALRDGEGSKTTVPERFLNQAMEFAYNEGLKRGLEEVDKRSFELGLRSAQIKVIQALGIEGS